MTPTHAFISALCAEYGIRIIPANQYPAIGETRAVVTMQRIMARFGEGHLRMVLTTLAETANNKAILDEVGLWMASDMIRACQQIVDTRAGEWLDVWDKMPAGELQFITRDLSGIVPQRHALGGMIYERLVRVFGPQANQLDMLDDRRQP